MKCTATLNANAEMMRDVEVGEEERKDGKLESRKDEKKKERKDEDRE